MNSSYDQFDFLHRKIQPEAIKFRRIRKRNFILSLYVKSNNHGLAASRWCDKLMVRLWEDRLTVVLRCTWEERERLLEIHSDVFYLGTMPAEHF